MIFIFNKTAEILEKAGFDHKHCKGFKCIRNLATNIMKALSALEISPQTL